MVRILPAVKAGRRFLATALLSALPACTSTPAAGPVPPKSAWSATASSLQEDLYPAARACDGDRETRWSSLAEDPQWIEIDLGNAATVSGILLHWETAFASSYAVEIFDGTRWNPVYATSRGDGRLDVIRFDPRPARRVRVRGEKRGTGWGYSLWEIDVLGESEAMRASWNGSPLAGAGVLGDGSESSALDLPGTGSLVFDLGRPFDLSGARIDWGPNPAARVTAFLSPDGVTWTKTAEEATGGTFDVLMHGVQSARYLRLDLIATADQDVVSIGEITLRGPGEVLTPLAAYELAALKAPPGRYPESLRRRQVYWTVVGIPGDYRESLFDEYGNCEPRQGGPIVMPYLHYDGRLVGALDARVSTSMDDSAPLPRVRWDLDRARLDIEASAAGTPGRSMTALRYTLTNTGHRILEGAFFLSVRPVQINPSWQYGGLATIDSLQVASTSSATTLAGRDGLLLSLFAPASGGVRPFDRGDVAREMESDTVPGSASLENAGDQLSGALRMPFRLEPGESRTWVAAAPHARLSPSALSVAPRTSLDFDRLLEAGRASWRRRLGEARILLPDPALTDLLARQIQHALSNMDSVAFQPGSRQYKRSWIRDGAMIATMFHYAGLHDHVASYLDWYRNFITDSGLVPPSFRADDPLDAGPGSGIEWDGQGCYVHAVVEHYRFTGDRAFLARHFPSVLASLRFLVSLRERTLAPGYMADEPSPERFRGILPKSFSHEGYYPEMHSYWDDFWALRGWKDGITAAESLGRRDLVPWMKSQYDALRDSLAVSIEATRALKGIAYVPGCAEKGDFDPTSTSIALLPCDEAGLIDETALRATYDRYFADIEKRMNPGWAGGFTPYEGRNIAALALLGMTDRAAAVLGDIAGRAWPPGWGILPEVMLGDRRVGSYIGDMPHTWCGASVFNAVRLILVREKPGRILLLDGTPPAWLSDSRGVSLVALPTWQGSLDLTARTEGETFVVEIRGGERGGTRHLAWPALGGAMTPRRVLVNGRTLPAIDPRGLDLPPGRVRVEAFYGP